MRVLFIGRFQPFHRGHAAILDTLDDDVILGIGSADLEATPENPFSCRERMEMVLRSGYRPFIMLPIPDINDYPRWVGHVESLVPEFDEVVTNNPRDRRLFTDAGYPLHEVPLLKRDEYNGTNIRDRMMKGDPWEHLVPEGTVAVIRTIDLAERFRR